MLRHRCIVSAQELRGEQLRERFVYCQNQHILEMICSGFSKALVLEKLPAVI